MKRSEMIRKIQVLLENRGYVGNCDDGEAVLDLIEECGMLPPRVVNNTCLDVDEHEWEEEDIKNTDIVRGLSYDNKKISVKGR